MCNKINNFWNKIWSKLQTCVEAFKVHILGIKGSSTQGSDTRRMTMRLCLYFSLFYFT